VTAHIVLIITMLVAAADLAVMAVRVPQVTA
jgi:hypothetical protein